MKLKHIAAALVVAASGAAQAEQVSFIFNYTDAAGYGFNDAVYGAQRRATMEAAGAYWSSLLGASYAGETIRIDVYGNPSATSSSPGSSQGPAQVYFDNGSRYGSVLYEHLKGANYNGTAADATMSYNFTSAIAADTYLGLDGNPGANDFDLLTYNKRYIARILGMETGVDRGNTPGDGYNKGAYYGAPRFYDRFAAELQTDGTYKFLTTMTDSQRAAAMSGGKLYWMGANATVANGGEFVKLYAPALGSDGTINTNAAVWMDPSEENLLSFGLPRGAARTGDAVSFGMLQDLGWAITPVPEASTYAMLLAGLGMIGVMARRRV